MTIQATSLVVSLLLMLVGPTIAAQDDQLRMPHDRAGQGPRREALSPQDSLSTIEVDAGLQVELVASEPNVVDPVAIRFDEYGRMWVVEMSDYPLGGTLTGTDLPSQSRIRVLQDEDDDGYFETAKTFVDGLSFATGLQPWRDGVFITMSGKVSYFEDRDLDGHADTETVWFTGFAEENSQLRANDPTLAIDGRIYVANGLRGGQIVSPQQPDEPRSISGRDFWFDPRSGSFDVATGGGQFGMSFDIAGHRFICSNREPLVHVVIRHRYADIAPSALPPSLKQPVANSGFESQLFPISESWTTSNLHAGQFTAACGVTIFTGNGLGDEYVGNAFTCDPTGHLVHREAMSDDGASFTSTSPYNAREFLAAQDSWFRPVNLEVGPDGALYVVDMHRAVIEHPQFVPEELKHRPDQRWGDRQGRIYRVTRQRKSDQRKTQQREKPWPSGTRPARDLLFDGLSHSNGWHRETAFRLLLEGSLTSTEATWLTQRVTEPKNAAQCLLALGILANHQELHLSVLELATTSAHVEVREFAFRLLDQWMEHESAQHQLGEDQRKVIQSCLAKGITDNHARVRLQCLLTLAASPLSSDARLALLSEFPTDQDLDQWQRHAMLMATHDCHMAFLVQLLARHASAMDLAKQQLEQTITSVAALLASTDECQAAIIALLGSWSSDDSSVWILPVLHAMLDADPQDTTKALRITLDDLPNVRDSLLTTLSEQRGEQGSLEQRKKATRLLIACRPEELANIESEFFNAANPDQRTELLAVLTNHQPSQRFWDEVVSGFRSETPINRQHILTGLLIRPDGQATLLHALQSGKIKAAEIDVTQRQTLLRRAAPKLRDSFKSILDRSIDGNRRDIYDRYAPSITKQGNSAQGRALFATHCAKCHRIGELGADVAPDISDSRTRTHEQLLADILQPNLAIDANYLGYVVETVEGKVFTGVIIEETADSFVLRMAEGEQIRFLRSDIESLISTGKSLMPEGFEQDLSPAQMNDLISFIKNWRYLASDVPAEGFFDQH